MFSWHTFYKLTLYFIVNKLNEKNHCLFRLNSWEKKYVIVCFATTAVSVYIQIYLTSSIHLSYIIYYIDLWRQYCHAMLCVDLMILRMIYLGGQLCLWICFNLLFYFSYDWYVTVKTLFLFLNLCLSVKLDILSWSFSSMYFLTNCEYLFPCMDNDLTAGVIYWINCQ